MSKKYDLSMLPIMEERTVNNPTYLYSAEKTLQLVQEIYQQDGGDVVMDLQYPSDYWNTERAGPLQDKIRQVAKQVGWSDVLFFNGQALFQVNLAIAPRNK